MLEEVGDDNFFLFGLDANQVAQARINYQPQHIVEHS
ncbi:glycogen/starch/alpha-glucan phosphorylase, partial [Shewanella sp. SG44-6]|nr:glycogen/starch/alpha-glucan phosphorylase [Shewanella sp. SG44-6]